MAETRDAYVRKIKAKLDEWNAEIDRLHAKAEAAKGEAQIQYRTELNRLRAKSDSAREKMDELKLAGTDAWKDLKVGAETAWAALGEAVESAKSRFQ